jgi:hypothetical protein
MTRSVWSATVIAILGAAFCAGPLYSQAKPNFTGNWKLNLEKSNFGEGGGPESLTVAIEHKNDVFKYIAEGEANGQSFREEVELPIDGKDHPGPNGTSMMMQWEGSAIAFALKNDAGDVIQHGTIELSADGKTTTRSVLQKGDDGSENKRVEVYDKQ